jgi:biopolymer transport protein TolR
MAGGMMGRRDRGSRYRPLAEINVTPLVDVMLVLLIVFMVAAPLMTSGVTVDLPKASAAPLSQDSEPLTISLNAEGKIYLQETELPLSDLAPKLAAISDNKLDRRIFVRGDKALPYGRIMEVMATITQGGFTKVALLAEQSAAAPAAAPAPAAPMAAPTPAASPAAASPAASGPPTGAARRPGRG